MPTVVERQASRRPAEGSLRHVAACGRKDESHTEGPKKKCIRMGLLLASSGEAIRLCQIDCREASWRAEKQGIANWEQEAGRMRLMNYWLGGMYRANQSRARSGTPRRSAGSEKPWPSSA